MILKPSATLGLRKGWQTLANKLLANCDQLTACSCETILILNVFLNHENCSHASVEGAPKYRAMLLFPSGPLGLWASGGFHGLGGVPAKWREQKLREHTY